MQTTRLLKHHKSVYVCALEVCARVCLCVFVYAHARVCMRIIVSCVYAHVCVCVCVLLYIIACVLICGRCVFVRKNVHMLKYALGYVCVCVCVCADVVCVCVCADVVCVCVCVCVFVCV